MRDDELRLTDIKSCCRKIIRFTQGMSQDDFTANELVFDAIMHNLLVIGEASNYLSDEFQTAHPHIEWRKLVGLRNIVAHHYFGIDSDIVWDIVTTKVPELLEQLDSAN